MKQALLYSINAEHLANILNGNKTIEVRKRDLPQWAKDKLARGEIVEGYGYCTKGKPYIINHPYHSYMLVNDNSFDVLNGLVVVKFEVFYNEEIKLYKVDKSTEYYDKELSTMLMCGDELCQKACITYEQLETYLTEAKGYAHNLKNIKPVNMELGEFQTRYLIEETLKWHGEFDYVYQPLTKAPQSFMTAWVKGA